MMSLVLHLNNSIKVGGQTASKFRLEDFCPNFMWVLRDFSLDLKNMSSNGYLE